MAIRFVKISSPESVIHYLVEIIGRRLRAGERVLWQLSGGSAIAIELEVSKVLAHQPLDRLTVTLTDERPGPVGHPDSNWGQLERAGFKLPGAGLRPVLTGASTATDTAAFNRFLREQFNRCRYRVALLGIGPDGHTAGLPAQHAVEHPEFAAYYEAGSFRRISSTPAAIARLDEAVVFAVGEAKHPQIERLSRDLPFTEQSAQALKSVPQVTVFNDYKGGTL